MGRLWATVKAPDPRMAVLETNVPWQQAGAALLAAPQLLAVVAPGMEPGEWCITAAGGPPGVHFCHKDGFFAATRDKNDAIGFAQQTLQVWEREDKRTHLITRAREMVGNRPQTEQHHHKDVGHAGR